MEECRTSSAGWSSNPYVLLVILFATSHKAYSISCEVRASGGCSSTRVSEVCTTPNGSLPIGAMQYKTDAVWSGMKAMDVCFLVSATASMQSSVWLQLLVPIVEDSLVKRGIGVNGTINRYCLAMFAGSGSYAVTSYLMVSNQIFFPSSSFPTARRQLPRDKDTGDGYEAISYVLRTAPFRNDTYVGRSVMLVTDSGRNTTLRSNMTWEGVYQALVGNQVFFDAIVNSQFYHNGSNGSIAALGSNGTQRAFMQQPNGGFLFTTGQVIFNSTQPTVLQDYIPLAMAVGGSAWSIGLIGRDDLLVMRSFAEAYVSSHSIGPVQSLRLCLQCMCTVGGVTSCIPHSNQTLCQCLVGNSPWQCGITPSNTMTVATSLLQSTPRPTAMPEYMPDIIGSTLQTPNGDLQVTFNCTCIYDNVCSCDGAKFACVLLNSVNPRYVQCTSPYIMGGLPEGHYTLLVEASVGVQRTLKVFNFDFSNVSLPALQITATQSLPDISGNIRVQFSANRPKVRYFCSLGGGTMKPCSSPYLVGQGTPGIPLEHLLIVAVDTLDHMTSTILPIERPTNSPPTTTPGPVMITTSVGVPDARGVLKIAFTTSRQDCICTCNVDTNSPMSCSGFYLADPWSLGAGPHTLVIACQAEDGTSTSINLKFNLNQPPPLPSGPFICNLDFNATVLGDLISANFTCNRPFIATCQVSNLPTEICKSPYVLSTQALSPGNQIFILVAEDGYGESLMKIYPFTVSSALRKCCPVIFRSSGISVNTSVPLTAQLRMEIGAGNCTQQDGFSYVINWGDGASDSGSRTHVGTVNTYRRYSYAGMYTIQMAVCNNPANTIDLCCDSILWPIEIISKT